MKNTTNEENYDNLKSLYELIDGEHKYTWVNLRSLKCLQRETNLMSNCVATYWTDENKTGEPSDFYSLRDENNNPIITLNIKITGTSQNDNTIFLKNDNIKCYFHKIDPSLCKLSEEHLNDFKEIEDSLLDLESYFRLSTAQLYAQYNHPKSIDFITLDIIEAKQKYNDPVEVENTNLICEFINKYLIANILNKKDLIINNKDKSLLTTITQNKLESFNDIILNNESIPPFYSPNIAYEELSKKLPINKILNKCYYENIYFDNSILSNNVFAKNFYINNIKNIETITIKDNSFIEINNCKNLFTEIHQNKQYKHYYNFSNTENSIININLNRLFISDSNYIANTYVIMNFQSCSKNKLTIKKLIHDYSKNNKKQGEENTRNIYIYVLDDCNNDNIIENSSPASIFKFKIGKQQSFFEIIQPTKIINDKFPLINEPDSTHIKNIINLLIEQKFNNNECIEKHILSSLILNIDSINNTILIGNSTFNTYDFFKTLNDFPEKIITDVLFANKITDIFDMKNIHHLYYFVENENKYDLILDDIQTYKKNAETILEPMNLRFFESLQKNDDYALGQYLLDLIEFCENNTFPINLYLIQEIKKNIINIASQINNDIANSILSGGKEKIRDGRIKRIVNYIAQETNLEKSSLEFIFTSPNNPLNNKLKNN